jgi:hypothetical protein
LAHEAYDYLVGAEYGQGPPQAGIEAFRRAVEANPAFLFHEDLFYGYLGSIPLVEPPPVANEHITSVAIHYSWEGLGSEPIEYFLRIADADSRPRIETTFVKGVPPSNPPSELNPDAVQPLALALTDLIPISQALSLVNCTDNYPDWSVDLVFADGSVVELVTNGSNILTLGGPWQATISGSNYVQLSSSFAEALYLLVMGLDLPLGEPAAMFCFPAPIFTTVFGE